MKAIITAKTETFIACPECGKSTHRWGDRKPGSSFGPWYCDNCGLGIKGVATKDDADIELTKDRSVKTLVLLRLFEPLSGGEQVHIVIESSVRVAPGEDPDFDHHEYLYGEHQCPWNYLRFPLKLGDYTDPHGVFQHQETILMPDGYDEHHDLDDAGKWKELFPSLQEEIQS